MGGQRSFFRKSVHTPSETPARTDSFGFARGIIHTQRHHCSSPGTRLRGRIPEINDVGGSLEDRSNHLALDSDSLSVNNAQTARAAAVRFLDIILNNRANLPRRDRVQVDDVSEFDCDNIREWIVRVQRVIFVLIGDRDGRSFAAPSS